MARQRPWKEQWEQVPGWTKSGGQGFVHLVRRKGDTTGAEFVLKELKKQGDPERRSRMRREVVALETLPHPSTPDVVDNNTEHHSNSDVALFAVFEFIDGPTLADYVTDCKTPLSLLDATVMVERLLDALEFYHSNSVGHRDIKPDNIILRTANCADPVLIDFGLTFNADDEALPVTWSGQQVGNRFLALPEHASTSGNKRDLRSDLTFCVGILFFALTVIEPAVLSDENGRLPHQRDLPRSRLELLFEPQKSRVLHIFDRGFRLSLSERWQSVPALRQQLGQLKASEVGVLDTDAAIAHLKERANVVGSNRAVLDALEAIRKRVEAAALNAVVRLGSGYRPSIERRPASMNGVNAWIRCGVDAVLEGKRVDTAFLISAVGDEIVVEELFHQNRRDVRGRVPLIDPDGTPELHAIIVDVIIANVAAGLA